MWHQKYIGAGAQLAGGRREVSTAFFKKLNKIALILEKKRPDCVHLWVTFLI